jgi:hypothetical protein
MDSFWHWLPENPNAGKHSSTLEHAVQRNYMSIVHRVIPHEPEVFMCTRVWALPVEMGQNQIPSSIAFLLKAKSHT